ncbi:hypothetical protein NG697_03495 [Pseudarthrobacter sp. MDT3-26]|uniref:glycosyl hydrolase family 65 protein n=1 Tax=Pseudarthrobacter raffinosi TaxID=2953651 RepID=UPI00208F0AFF|nr:glycosyl hydrolase family 65 protein [Pseudarthrobacter sp. MDT3-26]MCO4262005.1 hypothetical protein [Pseudarthrobacter sp. MDT3-26]
MAGTIDVISAALLASESPVMLFFSPQKCQKKLESVSFRVRYRDHLLAVNLEHGTLTVSAAPGDASAIRLQVGSERVLLGAGDTRHFPLVAG